MKQNAFHRVMSYIDNDIVDAFLDIKSKKERKISSQRKTHSFLKWGSMAAVFCLVLATSLVLIFTHLGQNADPALTLPAGVDPAVTLPMGADPAFSLPTDADQILWYEKSNVLCDEDASMVTWRGIQVSEALYEALCRAENDRYLAVIVRYRTDERLNQYVFDGKSYLERERELDALRSLTNRYEMLQKEGEQLKFKERLYTEGLADGTKWTKDFYEERIAFYGESLLSEFIESGVFLAEKLENSLSQTRQQIREEEQKISDSIQSYDESVAPALVRAFEAYAVTAKNGTVYLFITPSALASLAVENKADYAMYLASRAGYEGHLSDAASPDIQDTVSGFACDKIVFDSLDTENLRPSNDEAVLRLLNETVEKWQYTCDCVEFTFYYRGVLTEEMFQEMRYAGIVQTDSPARMIVQVKYADINTEALKELSQMAEITSIHIAASTGSLPQPNAAEDPSSP